MKTEVKNIALDGVIRQNPIFRLVLGTCPALAVSFAIINGICMGLVVAFVLVCSNFMISLLRNVIPDKVRIPAFILIIATFATVVEMAVRWISLDLYDTLGVYLPLVAVNCIVLARAEAFASSNKPLASVLDGLFMGLGYTLALCLICVVREVLVSGCFVGYKLWDFKIMIFTKPAGAFLSFGFVLASFNAVYAWVVRRQKHRLAREGHGNGEGHAPPLESTNG